jgi:hypothetical protein
MPMSSPMMTTMLGFCCCWASAGNAAIAAATSVTNPRLREAILIRLFSHFIDEDAGRRTIAAYAAHCVRLMGKRRLRNVQPYRIPKLSQPPGIVAMQFRQILRIFHTIGGFGSNSNFRSAPWLIVQLARPLAHYHRKKARRSPPHSITSVTLAVRVYAPTLEGRDLLQGQAVAISRTTDIYALLLGCLSRRKGERGGFGVARIDWARTHN